MSRKLLPFSLATTLMGGTAFADELSVAVDIAPVHSLVARVMEGVGSPNLVIQQGASPHEYSLRPSEAEALQNANVVFWIGEDLTPWLEEAVETLATDASVSTLLEVEGIPLHNFRENALFEAHAHGEDDHGHDEHAREEEHAHDDHDHDHAEHAENDKDHSHDHDDHGHDDHAHDHGEHDPHAWLSPSAASVWLNEIAADLSAADPDNAGTYFANAAAAREEIASLIAEINDILDPVRGSSFIVFHDAYQYFEVDFGLPAAGAISLSDAADPSPARMAEIQSRIQKEGIDCVLAEPQFNPGLVEVVLESTEAKTAVIDPLGVELDLGPELYPRLIRNMATTLAGCL